METASYSTASPARAVAQSEILKWAIKRAMKWSDVSPRSLLHDEQRSPERKDLFHLFIRKLVPTDLPEELGQRLNILNAASEDGLNDGRVELFGKRPPAEAAFPEPV